MNVRVYLDSNFILKHSQLNCTFMIAQKDGELNHPGTEELFCFFLSYDKPCGELQALGENCIRL